MLILKPKSYKKCCEKRFHGNRTVLETPTAASTADFTTADFIHEVQPVIERIRGQKGGRRDSGRWEHFVQDAIAFLERGGSCRI
ncbi:hypothetical protein quinque_015991 [Culex quinquefasciatus]